MQDFDASCPTDQRPPSRSQATARRLRRLTCVVLGIELAFVMGILSCNPQGCSSGQTNPSGYQCGSLSGGGAPCWAMVSFCCGSPPSGGFFPPSILGYHTSVYINQSTMSGDGSIGHALALLASNSSNFIMIGYENLANAAILSGCSAAGSWYFLEQSDVSGVSHQCLVSVPSADFGQYADVSIEPNGPPPTATSFTFTIKTQATNQTNTLNIPLWPSNGPQFARVEFGERLIGSQGASATTVLFYNNSWLDSSRQVHLQSYDGGVTAGNPPFGGWVTPPSQSTAGDGGQFFAECCVAPDTVYPAGVNFGTVTTGTTSAATTVLITNNINSAGTLNITSINITGANASDFKIATNGCGSSLQPLNSCSLTITFTPTATGARTATLTVSDNGGSGSGTDSATLTGTGG